MIWKFLKQNVLFPNCLIGYNIDNIEVANLVYTGLLILHDGAISHNRPQIASDRIIPE